MGGGSGQTLTFLFTDLEGSTRLWEERPELMVTSLAHHDGLLRDAVEGHGGRLVKSTGDGAMAAFDAPADGVAAAVAAQLALHAAEWPDGVQLRVRMGVHAGEATERDGDWFGAEVNRTARVMAAAHGGQILCTGVVGEQVRGTFPLLDLGEHRLRDLQSPVHVFQVDVPGVSIAFPPLRSLDAYRSNLPYELSSFVGREDQLRSLADRVGSSRVVSIVGVGGVGKTRLALQVGSELLPHYPDGVWFCELAHVHHPDDVVDAIAASVRFVPSHGVAVADGLPRFLERKELLLVLDNCEHLIEAVADWVTDAITRAARLSVLATSREALGVRGEHVSPLASLGLPSDGNADAAAVLTSEAGALFVARAEEARGGLVLDDNTAQAVAELCVRLDGIPLALELAAAQTKVMTPREIVTRLDKQFRLVTGGHRTRLERHQTLRAAIDWSYDLLDADEQAMLGRLSVCVGGFDIDAAAALADGFGADEFDAVELLASLVAKSLVERTERDGTTRYRLLEMIRQYAGEQLIAAGAAAEARDAHARHFLAQASELFRQSTGAGDWEALAAIELETRNISTAGRWLLANGRVAPLLGFFAGLSFLDPFSFPVDALDDLGAVAGEVIANPDAVGEPGFEQACWVACNRAFFAGDWAEYRRVAELSDRSLGDRCTALTPALLSTAALFDGDTARAAAEMTRSVARAQEAGDPTELSWFLAYWALPVNRDDTAEGIPVAREALALARSTGSTVALLYPLLALMTDTEEVDPEHSLAAAEELTRLDRTRRKTYANLARGMSAILLMRRGEVADGMSLWRESFRAWVDQGEHSVLSLAIASVGGTIAAGDPICAVEFGAVAESHAISHMASFTAIRSLTPLLESHPDEVAAARARVRDMDYDEAVAHLDALMERLIGEPAAVGEEP